MRLMSTFLMEFVRLEDVFLCQDHGSALVNGFDLKRAHLIRPQKSFDVAPNAILKHIQVQVVSRIRVVERFHEKKARNWRQLNRRALVHLIRVRVVDSFRNFLRISMKHFKTIIGIPFSRSARALACELNSSSFIITYFSWFDISIQWVKRRYEHTHTWTTKIKIKMEWSANTVLL